MSPRHSKYSNKLLVSACLLGQPVRYDGQSKGLGAIEWLNTLEKQGRILVVCPEVAGGLPVPRAPAERVGEQIITTTGDDVTEAFQRGAQHALALCKQYNIGYALLKAKSPSCGNREIYDGRFSGKLKQGLGVTAELLQENGIEVYSELQITKLQSEFELNT